jgi:hypothetical protein
MNRPLFYVLMVPTKSGEYKFGGAFSTRQKAEEKAIALGTPFRIEAADGNDLEDSSYA